jgi:hypothetical protein
LKDTLLPADERDVLEVDEMWSFVGNKKGGGAGGGGSGAW